MQTPFELFDLYSNLNQNSDEIFCVKGNIFIGIPMAYYIELLMNSFGIGLDNSLIGENSKQS